MRFFPWFTEEFSSPLPPAEVLRRVQSITAPSFAGGRPAANVRAMSFQGRLKGNTIRIGRISTTNGRPYQALTVVEGEVHANAGGGSRLRLLHRPALLALFTLGFWLILTGTLVLVSLIGWLRHQQEYITWGPTYAFTACLLLFVLSFWREVHKAHRLLVPLLELEQVSQA